MTEVYLFFYNHVLDCFSRLNLFLQREEPVISVVHEEVSLQLQVVSLIVISLTDLQVHTVVDGEIFAYISHQGQGVT